MNTEKPFGGISGSTLKLIAIVTMFIDHFGATVLRAITRHPAIVNHSFWSGFWQNMYNCSRDIGRIAFPIFCFLLVEGFTHTRNVRKYASRMFLFALISEIPFDLALKGNWYFPGKQNVYFTLLIGLLTLIGLDWISRYYHTNTVMASQFKKILFTLISIAGCALFIFIGMKLAARIDTDYNYKGVLLIAVLYLTREMRLYQCFTGAIAVSWELPAPLGFIPVYLYNGTRGLKMKYFFYWFYPIHLLFLHVIADYIIPAL